MRDARILCNPVALDSGLEEGIAPYMLWSQKVEACAFEREFHKKILYSKMEVLKQATLFPEEQESINYETKLWFANHLAADMPAFETSRVLGWSCMDCHHG